MQRMRWKGDLDLTLSEQNKGKTDKWQWEWSLPQYLNSNTNKACFFPGFILTTANDDFF